MTPHTRRRAWKQQTLPLPNTWGGKRRGAGRKRIAARANVPHRARPGHVSAHPVHVTLRSVFRPLRSQHVFPTVCLAVSAATKRWPRRFRVIHFSAQSDHLHLIVEASDARSLSAGIRSLAVRIARSVNTLVLRRGRFWADRWHGRALTSPRAVRSALVYVLANFRKHAASPLAPGVDAFSSAVRFDGWSSRDTELPRAGPPYHAAMARWVDVAIARSWLGGRGWKRAGLLRVDEAPRT
jgi:putative transposase